MNDPWKDIREIIGPPEHDDIFDQHMRRVLADADALLHLISPLQDAISDLRWAEKTLPGTNFQATIIRAEEYLNQLAPHLRGA